jgi:proline dehydrogenase
MPGEDIGDALEAAEKLKSGGFATVVTHLGENLSKESEADAVAAHYIDVLDLIRKRGLDCHISVKPTQLGLDLNRDLCFRHLRALTARAKETGNFVWIDMESSAYVDPTLELFRRLRAEFQNVGVCLQSYLLRSAEDVEKLLPLAPSIRLVKGTYAEPKTVVFTLKRDVDESYFQLAKRLLLATTSVDAIIGVGTHDDALVRRIDSAVSGEGAERKSYEVQMLYGIRREAQMRLLSEGFKVRVLISYGTFWFPWYMRRLAERPANVWFVLRNLFAR